MKAIGIILIVLGIAGFAMGGFSFKTTEKVADLGPLEVKKENTHSFPIAPTAATVAVIAGIVLVVAGARRKA